MLKGAQENGEEAILNISNIIIISMVRNLFE